MRIIPVILALASIASFGCGSSDAEIKKRLSGNWTDGTHTAEFKDTGEV